MQTSGDVIQKFTYNEQGEESDAEDHRDCCLSAEVVIVVVI